MKDFFKHNPIILIVACIMLACVSFAIVYMVTT
jgi:hypothetical protein